MNFLNDVKAFFIERSISKARRNGIFKNKKRPKFQKKYFKINEDELPEYTDWVSIPVEIAEHISYNTELKTDINPLRLEKTRLLFNARFLLRHKIFDVDNYFSLESGIDFDLNNEHLYQFALSLLKHGKYILILRNSRDDLLIESKSRIQITLPEIVLSGIEQMILFYDYWKEHEPKLYVDYKHNIDQKPLSNRSLKCPVHGCQEYYAQCRHANI